MDLQAIFEKANEHYNNNRFLEAADAYNLILPYLQDNVVLHHNLGLTYYKLEMYDEAIDILKLAIEHKNYDSILTRGAIYRNQGKYKEALQDFSTAIGIDPTQSAAYSNTGNTLREFCLPDQAILMCQIAQIIDPKDQIHRLNESISHLLKGDYLAGWKLYDARWFYESKTSFKPLLPGPEYDGTQDIKGKKILMYGEQGFGDVIQFSRFVNYLTDREANVRLYVRTPLKRLIEYNFPNVEVTDNPEYKHDFDYHAPLLELPKCFNVTKNNIPSTFMNIDDTTVSKWHTLLGLKSKFRIGIVWSSTRKAFTCRFRQIELEKLVTSLDHPNIEFINLEYEYKDYQHVLQQHNIKIYNEHFNDFYDLGGLVKNLDLVIAVDTAVVHLAGALGVPVFLMLSDYAVDWRWGMSGTDNPWYPSVTLFRQTGQGWDTVLESIKNRLQLFVNK
jgi:tetratricopeptide (TPR) repeat protein